jgi:hypothetical protein
VKIQQVFQVINHSQAENERETQLEMDQDFLDVDGVLLRIVVRNDQASHFPVNARVTLTLEPII